MPAAACNGAEFLREESSFFDTLGLVALGSTMPGGGTPIPGRGAALEQHAEKQARPETVATVKQVRACALLPPRILASAPPPTIRSAVQLLPIAPETSCGDHGSLPCTL